MSKYPKHEKDDPLIGKTFGKFGQAEVLGWASKSANGIRKYKVKCLTCASDPELYGDACYNIAKNEILKDCMPCGCAINPKWKPWQYEVKLKREAKVRGCKFLGFIGEKVHARTYIKLSCDTCKTVWGSCTVSRFLIGNGCTYCKRQSIKLAQTKSISEMSAGFMKSGSFLEGTIFTRSARANSQGYHPYWFYECPKCSFDEYVQNGLCDGKFEAHGSHLVAGKLTCRCSANFYWTVEQRRYQINKLITSRGNKHEFVRWLGKYTGNKSKFEMCCSQHGTWTTSISSFIDVDRSCPACAGIGFDRNAPSAIYVLKISGEYYDFTGYGVSSSLKSRLVKHRKSLSEFNFKIAQKTIIPVSTKDKAFQIEQSIKDYFPRYSQQMEGFKTEATYAHLYDEVVSTVNALNDTENK